MSVLSRAGAPAETVVVRRAFDDAVESLHILRVDIDLATGACPVLADGGPGFEFHLPNPVIAKPGSIS